MLHPFLESYVMVYLGDILIFSKLEELNIEHVRSVLE